MAQPTYRQALGFAKETTLGTAVVATSFMPVKKPSGFVTQFEDIEDDGWRNNASALQGSQQGVGMTPIDTGELLVYADDSLHPIAWMLGVDTVTGAGPYTHVLTLLNTADPQSGTLTLFDNIAATARRVAGFTPTEISLKWSQRTALKMNVKGWGSIADSVTKPAETYSAALPYRGFALATTLSGSGNTNVEEGEIILRRAADPIYAAGTQNPGQRVVPELDVSGSLTLVASASDVELLYYLNYTIPAGLFVWTSGANTLTVQMTKMRFGKGSDIDRGSKYHRVKMPFRAIANATDAGTGNSPVKITGVNTKSTQYV